MKHENKRERIALYMKEKYIKGEAKGYEIIVALIAMAKDGRIDIDDIKPILMNVIDDPKELLNELQIAYEIVDEELVNSIIEYVQKSAP